MTNERNFDLHDGKTGSALAVRIIPRSSRNEITEILDDGMVKIRLAVPNLEEPANQGLIKFLAELLQINPANIEIVAGQHGKDKLVTILGVDSATLQQCIMKKAG